MLFPTPPVAPAGSPSPCRASPTCRSEVRPWPRVGRGGPGWWHKQGWLLGGPWEEVPPQLSLPHPEGPGAFPPNFKESGLLGSLNMGGGVCHGHIPSANYVPQCQPCPQGQSCPQARSHPKGIHVPMANHIAKTKHVPSATCVPKANPIPKPATSPVPTTSPRPTASPRPTMSPTTSLSLRLVMCLGPLSPMLQGCPAQPVPFGPLHLSTAGRATPRALGHRHVLLMSPRDQPGH